MTSLTTRLQEATGLDRELDFAIGFELAGWTRVERFGDTYIRTPDGNIYADAYGGMAPSFTESVDAALELVERKLPGWSWAFFNHFKKGTCTAFICDGPVIDLVEATEAHAPTAPLAILAALISALSNQGEKE